MHPEVINIAGRIPVEKWIKGKSDAKTDSPSLSASAEYGGPLLQLIFPNIGKRALSSNRPPMIHTTVIHGTHQISRFNLHPHQRMSK